VLLAGASAEVGGEPTAATDVDVDAAMTGGVDRWSHGGTPFSTSEEHFQTELP
jgi:hypothetical protein